MPVLANAKHERVAQLAAQGIDGTHAYMTVYPKSSSDAARANAARLLAIDSVSQRVVELQGRAAEKVSVTLAQAVDRAWEIAQQDERDRVPAIAVVVNALKPTEANPPSQTLILSGLSSEQLDAAIAKLAGRGS